jgi:hypothetical protein
MGSWLQGVRQTDLAMGWAHMRLLRLCMCPAGEGCPLTKNYAADCSAHPSLFVRFVLLGVFGRV